MSAKVSVFLGDLVHTWKRNSVWNMPLNIGFIAAYAAKHVAESVEYTLFKRPEHLIEAIKTRKPAVVALSYYIWNENLNDFVFKLCKSINQNILTIGGGPNITDLNSSESHATTFFQNHPHCDVYVLNQGEKGFSDVVNLFLDRGALVAGLTRSAIPGCLVFRREDQEALVGGKIDSIQSLDDIPSPYLTGIMDPFFHEPFMPMFETNRSCPYRCTFCAWGIGSKKLTQFSDQRIFDEIDYISKRCTKTALWRITDANFGILERDVGIARRLLQNHNRYGQPKHVMCNWNKSRPDRVFRVAKELGDICEVGASMQTLNDDTLKEVKRRNLSLSDIVSIRDNLKSSGSTTPLIGELILGLPLDTARAQIESNKRLVDMNVEPVNYNAILLPGTEMASPETRKAHFRKTGWRLCDDSFGVYDEVKIFEGLEIVRETTTMTEHEIWSFRLFHFMMQFLWGREWYVDYLSLFRAFGTHPVNAVVRITDAFRKTDGDLGQVYRDFCADHSLESFDSMTSLIDYWSREENLARLAEGSYGKLNSVYQFRILLEHQNAFNAFLHEFALAEWAEMGLSNRDELSAMCGEVLRFASSLRIPIDSDLSFPLTRTVSFRYDILEWRQCARSGLPRKVDGAGAVYDFYVPERQRSLLSIQLEQFRSHSLQMTLRKMATDTRANQFFYESRRADLLDSMAFDTMSKSY
jgi:radical SAM superfamily enzyme YgiQ (UPF0313 family)